MMDTTQFALVIAGLVANFLAVVHFFNKIEHRLTRTEIHVLHIMKKQGMSIREADLNLGGEDG